MDSAVYAHVGRREIYPRHRPRLRKDGSPVCKHLRKKAAKDPHWNLMAAKKHHYVPVFYQKGFADADGLLWVYDRNHETSKQLHPKVVCRAEDLYAVRPKNAPRDRTIETDVLSPIESVA